MGAMHSPTIASALFKVADEVETKVSALSPLDSQVHRLRELAERLSRGQEDVLDGNRVLVRGDTITVSLWYPRSDAVKRIAVELIDVRAADGFTFSYDFERDGWAIERDVTRDEDGHAVLTGDVGEVAFVPAWTDWSEPEPSVESDTEAARNAVIEARNDCVTHRGAQWTMAKFDDALSAYRVAARADTGWKRRLAEFNAAPESWDDTANKTAPVQAAAEEEDAGDMGQVARNAIKDGNAGIADLVAQAGALGVTVGTEPYGAMRRLHESRKPIPGERLGLGPDSGDYVITNLRHEVTDPPGLDGLDPGDLDPGKPVIMGDGEDYQCERPTGHDGTCGYVVPVETVDIRCECGQSHMVLRVDPCMWTKCWACHRAHQHVQAAAADDDADPADTLTRATVAVLGPDAVPAESWDELWTREHEQS